MSKIFCGPTGGVIKGHVMDVSVTAFSRVLKDYDSQLYVVWNPKKLKKHGCWEIRRSPNRKTSVYKGTHEGVKFYSLENVEYNMVHHVLDCAFLNYDAMRKLKEMDTFAVNNWAEQLERDESYRNDKRKEKAKEALQYAIKQNRQAFRDFIELQRSGQSPGRILSSVKWGSN